MEGKIAVFLFGLLFGGLGMFLWWNDKKKRKECTAEVAGVVKDVGKSVSYKKGKVKNSFRPTFAYSVEGVEYVKQTNTTSGKNHFSEGQKVTVFYDPSKPQRFYVLEEKKLTALYMLLVGIGVAVMVAAPFVTMATQ